MMLFALVEVVMIVVGIVMANQLEEQRRKSQSRTSEPHVVRRSVVEHPVLKLDCWASISTVNTC